MRLKKGRVGRKIANIARDRETKNLEPERTQKDVRISGGDLCKPFRFLIGGMGEGSQGSARLFNPPGCSERSGHRNIVARKTNSKLTAEGGGATKGIAGVARHRKANRRGGLCLYRSDG